MRCLGIDPGIATIGIGIIEAHSRQQMRAVDWMVIATSPTLPLCERLAEIERDLRAIVDDVRPERVAVERLFFATNEASGLEVAHARGVILLTVQRSALPLWEPTPLQLKQSITGDGQADKKQMQEMVQRLLELPSPPTPADAADALALGVYAALQL